jgi:hypothetical protein
MTKGHDAKLLASYLRKMKDTNVTLKMVGPGRVELPTSRLSGVRSNHLSYEPLCFVQQDEIGGAEESRTPDPKLAKLVLYQLSYSPVSIGTLTEFSEI